jgi:acyl-CoA synthetase (AMP-forming)/AMP-acid ligase II
LKALFSTVPNADRGKIVRCPYPDIEIPRKTLYSFVSENFSKFGPKTAIINGETGKEISYNEFQDMVGRIGSAFTKMGVQKDDVLSIVSPNCPEYVVQLLASVAIGAIAHPINYTFTPMEIAYQFKDCGTKYIATMSSVLPVVKEAAGQVGIPSDRIIVLDADGHGEHISFRKLLEDSGSSFPNGGVQVDPDSTTCLPYSSGTTGLPKGVMLSHSNLVANLCQIDHHEILGFDQNSILMCLLPLFHIYGMTVILSYGLKKGCSLVSLPQFEPEVFLKAMAEYRVTDALLVPPLILFLAKHPLVGKYQLSHLKQIFSGAAPLTGELSTVARDRLGKELVVRQGYGLTETSPVTHVCPKNVHKPSSIGPPVINTEVAIVDQDTRERLGADRIGEVVIKGPQVMKGYLNRPKETSACLTEDGWFYSGDVGYYDEDGHFYIVDRLKELIKVKGFQVAPAELEGLLLTHPQIADCAVVGVADERAGEVPRAFVVRKSKDVSEQDVENFVASKVSKHKHLKGGVVFVDAVPKSPSGKILRRLLREQ